mgnify:CR=1 FL=1
MYFKLADGVPVWATHEKDGNYYFKGDVIPDSATEVEQPTQEVLERAEKLKGKTYSRSEFEKLLFNPTQEEGLEERVNELELYILMGEGLI